jgi:hypothetical protein
MQNALKKRETGVMQFVNKTIVAIFLNLLLKKSKD